MPGQHFTAAKDVWKPMLQAHKNVADCPSMREKRIDCNREHMSQADVEHCMLPQGTGMQPGVVQNHSQGSERHSFCSYRNLSSVNSGNIRCKEVSNESIGYRSGHVWDAAARVGDPELTAALKPEMGSCTHGMQSHVLAQDNRRCGFLFDQPKASSRSGLQYTLGGDDCTFGGTAAGWVDPAGRNKISHRRFLRHRQ